MYILEVIDSSVTLKPVKEETEHMKLDDTYNAYMAYLKGDEKYLKQFGNEHNKFLAALKAMNMQHHERITKVLVWLCKIHWSIINIPCMESILKIKKRAL